MKKRLLAFTLALAACFALCACGGPAATPATPSSDSAASAPVSTPAESVSTPEDETSDLAYVEAKGSLVIGYTVYEPMNYTDAAGSFTGFDTELAEAVCVELGLTPEFVEINWETKEIELAAKSIDCVWNGLTTDEERKANMEITEPYVENAQVVVMKADAEYSDTASLAGKTVCAEAGSAGETTVEQDEGLAQAEYVAKDVQTACLMEVAAGTADAAVLDLTLAGAMVGEGTDYANLAIKDKLNAEYYGVAFRKGSDICARVNEIFAQMKDGLMADLAEKYNLALA